MSGYLSSSDWDKNGLTRQKNEHRFLKTPFVLLLNHNCNQVVIVFLCLDLSLLKVLYLNG